MSEAVDYGRFAERMRRAAERGRSAFWELLRDFQREWGYQDPEGPPRRSRQAEEDGFDEDDAARVDVSLPVPEALKEWWDLPFNSFVHSPRLYYTHPEWPPTIRPDPTGQGVSDALPVCNPFVGPGEDRRVCVFMAEYEYCNEWGYLAAEACRPDPRVLVSTEDGWLLQGRSISEFFLQLAVQRLSHNHGWRLPLYPSEVIEHPGLLERIRGTYPEMGLLPWRELGVDSVAYGAPDAIIHVGRWGVADYPVVICARTREALVRVARTLRIDVVGPWIEPPRHGPDSDQEGGVGPVALTEGDVDGLGRWTVMAVHPAGPASSFTSGQVVSATDGDGTVTVTADAGGRVHVRLGDAEPQVRKLHEAEVTAVACVRSDGGPLVVTGDAEGTVRLWEPPGQPPEQPLTGRKEAVCALAAAVLPTGPAVAAAWGDGLVRLRDVRSGVDTDLWLGTGITGLELGSDGELQVRAGNGTTVLRLDSERLWPHRKIRLRLNEIDWASLRHAMGGAGDIPGLIMKVATPRTGDLGEGIDGLKEALLRWGEAYSATSAAVPFLVELACGRPHGAREDLFVILSRISRAHEEIDDERMRSLALEGRAAVEAQIPALVAALGGSDPVVRHGAAFVLADFPERALELVPVLQARYAVETDPVTAAALVLAVGDLTKERRDAPLEWLRGLLADAPCREVRAAAAVALLWCGVPELPDGLVQALREELAASESALEEVLWLWEGDRHEGLLQPLDDHPGELIELIGSLLESADRDTGPRLVERAGEVMRTWRAAPRRLLPPLAGLLDHEDETVARYAFEEIKRCGPAAARVADALAAMLRERRHRDRSDVVQVLGSLGDARCLPQLIDALPKAPGLYYTEDMVAGMAEHADELIPALRPLLAAHAPGSRRLAIGVGRWGVRAAPLVPELTGLLEGDGAGEEAAFALGAIGEAAAEAVPVLRRLLREGSSEGERREAAWALWRITGDGAEALEVLADAFRPSLSVEVAERLLDLGSAAAPAVPLLRPLLQEAADEESATAAACVIHRITGEADLLPRVIEAVAATPLGMLAVRALDGPGAAAAVPRLREIIDSARVLADGRWAVSQDLAYRALAAEALARITASAS
ncbi:HEAT repeat domain-containing protein [Thermomonospora curvata]|uniref:HEAT repeat domain-containing protein n=1 Tax=Thermomonospora curvata TaxID=2020 RepID=UPI0011D250A5|nr:HEAT repeat domain-containing protein [Thermomonospora curvata]